ncbi:MAG: glycosyltransferase [Bacteroidota bacterium]
MIKMLSQKYKLSVVLVTDEIVSQECHNFLKDNTYDYKIFKSTTPQFYWNAFKSIFSSLPLQVNYYHNKAAKQFCKAEIKSNDFVVVHTIRMAEFVTGIPCKKVIDLVDSIYLNYVRSRSRVRSFFWKMIYWIEEKRLYKYEVNATRNFDKVLLVNEDEKKFLETKCSCSNIVFLPNGVNSDLMGPNFSNTIINKELSVSFLGKMNYQPNIDAVIWFVQNVLPLCPNLKFYIIGVSPTKRILELATTNPSQIIVTGLVDNPYKIMLQSTAVIAPMQTGGGIQNKILEAMAIGAVVLTTSLGAQPIQGAVDKEHLFICNSPQEYIQAIKMLQHNNELKRIMEENAKKLINQRYTWDICKTKIMKELDSIQFN